MKGEREREDNIRPEASILYGKGRGEEGDFYFKRVNIKWSGLIGDNC